jgi:hypothetical protein
MNRDEFFAKLADRSADQVAKAMWNLYWRGSAQMRERIEAELDPEQKEARKRAAAEPPDPDLVLLDARTFAALAGAVPTSPATDGFRRGNGHSGGLHSAGWPLTRWRRCAPRTPNRRRKPSRC